MAVNPYSVKLGTFSSLRHARSQGGPTHQTIADGVYIDTLNGQRCRVSRLSGI